ncbi:gliding motility-associated ABC transporter substrate-binding protein GldG [Olivibacter sp. CPCC 100613]|uniref:gliding motility-associated ABC transporter substrate-binding protein GldG n=1 Tax=Olivibacter sp. CPCC 100613 TaxID=3079931 RepID=UPI002FFB894D
MFSILRKDVSTFFHSLIGYLTIGLFLIISGLFLWVFPETSVLQYGYASLEGFFAIAPYIFMFLIPAITMRAVAGEREEGTYEWLMTKPITFAQFILAKYMSCLLIVSLAILPTAIYYVSIYCLGAPVGNIDTGAVIGSYIGLFLLGAAFCSVGIFISAVCDNAVVAFLLSAFLCFSLFIGFDYLSSLFVDGSLSEALAYLGIFAHYESVSRGVLDLRDFCFFISLSTLFLVLTDLFIEKNRRTVWERLKRIGLMLLTLIAINFLANYNFFRMDFTSEKRYTLSKISKKVLRSLTEDLRVVVFLDGELPAGFQRLRSATKDMLADLKAYAGGQIKYTFINPLTENDGGQQNYIEALAARGIEPTNLSVKTNEGLSQKTIFPVAVLMYGDEELPLPLLQNNRFVNPEDVLNNSVQNLEYTFINGIKKITSGGKPIVAFTEGHGELNDLAIYDAMHSLGVTYQVGRLNLDSISFETLRRINVMVVAKPQKEFSELHKFKIDYFVQHGGKILWAINQVQAELDSMRNSGDEMAIARSLNLDDMLFKYGVRLNYNLIADLNCTQIPLRVGELGGANQFQLVPWLFYPVFVPRGTHPIVKNIDGIRSEFPGTLDTLPLASLKKEIILQSSPFSKVLNVPVPISLNMVSNNPKPEEFRGTSHPVGVVLEGIFPSVFKNRPVPKALVDTFTYRQQQASISNKMIVLADGNMLKNEINPQDRMPYNLGWDRATQQQYGNKTLLLNMVDYLNDETGIIALREKEVKLRLLDKLLIKKNKFFWQTLNVGGPLVLLVLFGLLQQWIRRRKYAR